MFLNKQLISYAKASIRYVCVTCTLELILALLGTGVSICASFIVSYIIAREIQTTIITVLFGISLLMLLLKHRLFLCKTRMATICSAEIKDSLRDKLIAKIFELGPAYLARTRTGVIANTLVNKVEWLSNYYIYYLPTMVSAGINAILVLVPLFFFDWVTGIVCLFACIGMFACPNLFYPIMSVRGEKEWNAHSAYYSDCLDSIQGMTTLKAFNANQTRREFIHKSGENLRIKIMEQLKITMAETGVMDLFSRVGSTLSVAVAALRAATGATEPEQLIYVLFLAGACFTPMMNLANAWHLGYRGVTASKSIDEMLQMKGIRALLPSKEMDAPVSEIVEEVRFDHVCFSYSPDEPRVLHDISFAVPEGTMTAIVGLSGSGKSTIAQLLAGFYPVESGYISVGGCELCQSTVNDIQKMQSVVWQDSHIFYGTVYDNILMGRPNATEDEIIEAARKANLHDFVLTLPQGYRTMLGENGMRFSGGERQRVAIARAFLKDTPILIFDEATSSLDRKNELEIQKSFETLSKGKTALVIAHRLSTIKQATQILIIENGRVITAGTHNELEKCSEEYRMLMGKQLTDKVGG